MSTRRLLLASQNSVGGGNLEFPVYLVVGDNGQLGIDVYNYLINKYGTEKSQVSEEIYVENAQVTDILFSGDYMHLDLNSKPFIVILFDNGEIRG